MKLNITNINTIINYEGYGNTPFIERTKACELSCRHFNYIFHLQFFIWRNDLFLFYKNKNTHYELAML